MSKAIEQGDSIDVQSIPKSLQNKLKYEIPFIRSLALNGIPEPEHDNEACEFAKELGRKMRFDMCWPDRWLAVEIEGGIYLPTSGRHNRGVGFEADAMKYNLAALLGWTVLRFGPKEIESEAAIALTKLAYYYCKDRRYYAQQVKTGLTLWLAGYHPSKPRGRKKKQ